MKTVDDASALGIAFVAGLTMPHSFIGWASIAVAFLVVSFVTGFLDSMLADWIDD